MIDERELHDSFEPQSGVWASFYVESLSVAVLEEAIARTNRAYTWRLLTPEEMAQP